MKNRLISVTAAVIGALCIIYYFICGIIRGFGTSGLWIWLTFGLILILGVIWKKFWDPRMQPLKIYRIAKRLCLSLFALFILIFLVFEGFLIMEWTSGVGDVDSDADVLIVLGATVEHDRPGDVLRKRIDKAFEYHLKKPDATIIACGGLGEDDIITEADCIKRELISLGVPLELILTEDRSTSTAENFSYAAELIPEGTDKIAVVTSGFHQFRAGIMAKKALEDHKLSQTEIIPVSAPCTSVKLPCDMVREFAAIVRSII